MIKSHFKIAAVHGDTESPPLSTKTGSLWLIEVFCPGNGLPSRRYPFFGPRSIKTRLINATGGRARTFSCFSSFFASEQWLQSDIVPQDADDNRKYPVKRECRAAPRFRIVSLRIHGSVACFFFSFFSPPLTWTGWERGSVIKRCNLILTAYVALNKITSQKAGAKKKTGNGTGSTSVLIKNYRDGGTVKKRSDSGVSCSASFRASIFPVYFSSADQRRGKNRKRRERTTVIR